ncbi:unnamed protein product [Lathyrus sativus]|nr:unnamed protein product [Lathyrus sativus]
MICKSECCYQECCEAEEKSQQTNANNVDLVGQHSIMVAENPITYRIKTTISNNNTHSDDENISSTDELECAKETQPFVQQGIVVEIQSSKEDAIVEIQNRNEVFLKNSWANMNEVFLKKSKRADTMNMFRPIALSNFKYKIISKILADRLSSLMSSLISIEQREFINGRNIRGYTCFAS